MSAFGGYAQEIFFQLKSKGPAECGRVFLGSHQSAAHWSDLQQSKIQLVVNCTNDEEVPCSHLEKGLCYLRIAVNDNESAMIFPYLEGAADAIARAVGQGEHVLVHCHQGISRSATVVAAFLIRHCGLTAACAIEQIRSCRPVADPNLGFRHQLQQFQQFQQNQVSGDAQRSSLDQNWCYQSLGSFATGREAFAALRDLDASETWQAMLVGLDFVLGRGIKESDVLWFGSLLGTLNSSSERNALELLWQELTSEHFEECWGADFSPQMLQKTLYVTLKGQLEGFARKD